MAPKANPRRDDQVHRYERPKPASEEEGGSTGTGGEFYNLMSMMLGIAGLMMRYKLAAWGSLLFCIMSFVNTRSADIDYKQFAVSVSFSVMGLFMAYVGVTPGRMAADAVGATE